MDKLKASQEDLQDVQKQKIDTETILEQKTQENAQKEQEIESLRSQLQARQAAKASLASAQVSKASTVSRVNISGTCTDWINAAGITDTASATELLKRESGCNPTAVNPSSGACGVAQELPCGKSGCQLGDGACQMAWMHRYVLGRYGSWSNAVAAHNAKGWY